jgi:translation elongation factor EF-1alpha
LINGDKVKEAVVGDNIDLQIKLIDETAFEAIKPGHVLSSLKYSIPVTQKIVVEALALDLELPVLRGTGVVIYIATNKCPARITKINYIFNPSDGTVIKKNPKSIKANDCAEIEVELQEKMCAELFLNYKIFGRVIIREKK